MYTGMGTLGQTGAEYYQRAKDYLVRYVALVNNINRIANKESRESFIKELGSVSVADSPAYRAASVQDDVGQVEAHVPPATEVYDIQRRRNRVDKLGEILKSFEPRVAEAQSRFGVLPETQVKLVKEVVREPGKLIEEEFLGLPVKTWLYIAGGAAAVGIGVAIYSAARK